MDHFDDLSKLNIDLSSLPTPGSSSSPKFKFESKYIKSSKGYIVTVVRKVPYAAKVKVVKHKKDIEKAIMELEYKLMKGNVPSIQDGGTI